MLARARAMAARMQGPGARAAIGTALIVFGLHQMITFTQDIGAALAERADELDRIDAMIAERQEALILAGPPEVDHDVSRETSQDHVPGAGGDGWAASGQVPFDVVTE